MLTLVPFIGPSQTTVLLTSIPLLGAQVPVMKAHGEVEAYLQIFLTLSLDGED